MKDYLPIFLAGFLPVYLLTALLAKSFRKHAVMMSAGVPMSGGTAMALTLLAALAVWRFPLGAGLFVGAALITVMGILDDVRELSVRAKFLFQAAAAAALIAGGIRTHIYFLGDWLNLLVSFLWIVGITNSFNLLDISDGLAGGIALSVCAGFLTISLVNGDAVSSALICVFSGCIVGFLPHNLPPARAYMGNTGSHLIGFFLSAVALNVSYAPAPEYSLALASPLVILGFPIADTVFVILLRITNGRSAVAKSKDHLALRMLCAGYSKTRMLASMVLASLFFALCGVAICFLPPAFGLAFICSALGLTVFLSLRMSRVSIHG